MLHHGLRNSRWIVTIGLGLVIGSLGTLIQESTPKPVELKVGKPAPAFSLNNHKGQKTSVGGEADTFTVLAFFPKAATPG